MITPPAGPFIELQGVTKAYKSSKGSVSVIENMSFTVRPGEFYTILGPSGCGKTTLINLIAGFIQPTNGSISMNGKVVKSPGADRVVVFQNYGLFDWMTVRNNIAFGLKAKRIPRIEQTRIVQRYLALVHLSEFADLYPSELSGGMQQRLALARALAIDPGCLLMDEPLGALDSQVRMELQHEIAQILFGSRKTVIMVTHDVEEAIFLSDRVLILSPAPARVRSEITIDIGYPRLPEIRVSAPFQNLRKVVMDSINNC